ncbi:MAG: calcium-translocating P-type ATPase, PMCA-type [Clostridia bacterium]|nr:calcium-translocating P-type ATPase, PMCA-type [Clostridia bacterium]
MNRSDIFQRKECGLTSAEAAASRAEHGANVLSTRPSRGFIAHFISNLGDPVIKILLCALAVNLIFVFRGGDIIETAGIAVSVFLAAFISTVSERGGESAFMRLSEECSRADLRVRRDGKICNIPIEDIVVGDVLFVSAGEQIPADGYVLFGRATVDQSSMTGESREIEKCQSSDISRLPSSPSALFRGCLVLSGEVEMRVERVGDATFLGEISREIQLDTRESPLKVRLTKLAKQISRLGYIAAILISIAYLFNTFFIDSAFNMRLVAMKCLNLPYLLENLLHAFMLGLTVIVVAVPEGLPMMIAVVLSSNIKKMIKDNVLVRKPAGIEAAGSMNILFTDKTGTLTEGKLSLGEILLADGSTSANAENLKRRSESLFELFNISCRFNSSAVLYDGSALGGNSTDRALLEAVKKISPPQKCSIRSKIEFDSTKKYSSVSLGDGRTFIKGAPEKLLPFIKYCILPSGERVNFAHYSYAFAKSIGDMTSAGGRVILLAFSDNASHSPPLGDMTLICAVLLSDRLRKEAASAVSELKGAGVQVVMITGDNKETAEAIAKRCGIFDATRKIILTSDELARISDERLQEILPSLAVVARALPTDKSRLVKAAQALGLVTGMTGDGINDAPALRRADIGFAMGNGTQVAKDASDIIINDSNLSSIGRAILYGRNIFKSIRKFITLQLTMNFCAVGISMICPFMGIDSPVTVVQMLWINIIMDTLGGLAFAGEAALPSYMKEKPKRRDEPILNRYMINQILFLGSFTVALCLAFLKLPSITSHFRASGDNLCLLTAFFALFIFSSVFNCFNSRTERLSLFAGISKNKAFCLIMSAVCMIQIAFVYLGGSVLRTTPLTPHELIFTMLLSLSVFPAELLRKLLWRLRGKKEGF